MDDISSTAVGIGALPSSALQSLPFALVLTDPSLPDNPIVFVNRAFEATTGFSRSTVLGRNCRFLQGADRSQEQRMILARAIERCEEVTVDIRNYRADGEPFLNRLMVAPVFDERGALVYFVGVQMPIDGGAEGRALQRTEMALREIQHRVKNHLAMIVSLIRLQARRGEPPGDMATLSRRVEALQLLYEEMVQQSDAPADTVSLAAYLGRITHALGYLDGRAGVRVTTDFVDISTPISSAVRIGLTYSEVLTNCYQHAFEGRERGCITCGMERLTGGILRLRVADDGVGIAAGRAWPEGDSLGGQIVENLSTGLGAVVAVSSASAGTTVTIDIPEGVLQDTGAE